MHNPHLNRGYENLHLNPMQHLFVIVGQSPLDVLEILFVHLPLTFPERSCSMHWRQTLNGTHFLLFLGYFRG